MQLTLISKTNIKQTGGEGERKQEETAGLGRMRNRKESFAGAGGGRQKVKGVRRKRLSEDWLEGLKCGTCISVRLPF